MVAHIHSVTFNNQNLSSFGFYSSGNESFRKAEKNYETVEVPGRNGSLYYSSNSYKNVTVSYPGFIMQDENTSLDAKLDALLGFLLSQEGYKELSDTYHPNYFRLGVYKGPLDPEIMLLQAGVFTLEFDCKPQKFLVSGKTQVSYTSNSTINNPTLYSSKPLIRVTGNGTVGIGAFRLTTTNNDSTYIDIDCETMDCYRGSTNCNSYVTFTNSEFPVLVAGSNGITKTSGISKIQITPRWWTI